MRFRAALLGVSLVAGVTACGPVDAGENEINGKALFVEHCGACHALERAGTAGTAGPNLDHAFRRAREDGIGESTIAGIVEGQILHPGKSSAMPAGLVSGEDAEDVAAYVAQSAAVPGRDTGRLADAGVPEGGPPGRQVFARSGCGSCHRLADAGAAGATGPNLDRALEGRTSDFVRESIVDPDAVVAEGFSPGTMPSDYARRLSERELDDLVRYLTELGRSPAG